jgi:predicted transcriptional regulator
MAKKEINVLESSEHSLLIYIINNKEMYASEIARRVKEQQGTIQRRLMKLKNSDFIKIKKHPDKIKNIKLFYVNWNKILEEFVKLLKEQKDEFIEIHNNLKTNIKPERLKLLELLENQNFIKNLQNNKYLKKALIEYFYNISKIKKCSLYNALGYFTFFGDFEFTTLTHPSIRQVISQIELKKNLEKKDENNQEDFFNKNLKQNSKEWYDEMRKSHDNLMKNMTSRMDYEEKKIKEIIENDVDLKNILKFNDIRKFLGMDLGLQISLNDAIEQTAFYVMNNNFSKQEIEKYLDDIFFKHSLRYKGVSDNVKQEVREKIENMKENDTNAPKPNEIKHKEVNKK